MAEPKPRCTRQETAVVWASSHAGELAGVAVPLAAGAVWSPWMWLLSAGVAGVWARHEILLVRRTRAARQVTGTARQLTRAEEPGRDVDHEIATPAGARGKEAKA
ncbi:conjugal transfer protein TraH [Amycolatopsis japonica]|uniref:conjugal transfer protein TraH n=1 Tax=Amycolatopsis japonica TaxID=208439 RepID=UPI0033FBEFA8